MQIDPVVLQTLYPELRRMARRARQRAGRPTSFATTELIHEAWLRLGAQGEWCDPSHYLATAARAMRYVLIDTARARMRLKRAGRQVFAPWDDGAALSIADTAINDERLIDLGDVLDRLEHRDPRLAAIVECRFFAGYSEAETALAIGVTDRTVRRDWVKAKAWLTRELAA
jgi:RNA polymerase sigma factor (TIGR02999 family)